jgi:hypothetical protein
VSPICVRHARTVDRLLSSHQPAIVRRETMAGLARYALKPSSCIIFVGPHKFFCIDHSVGCHSRAFRSISRSTPRLHLELITAAKLEVCIRTDSGRTHRQSSSCCKMLPAIFALLLTFLNFRLMEAIPSRVARRPCLVCFYPFPCEVV